MESKLTNEYITELFNCAFKNQGFFEVLLEHLKYSFLTHEHEKKFWKKAIQIYRLNNKIPTLGLIQVEFRKEEKLRDYIVEIKSLPDFDELSTIEAFQEFIRESKFVELFQGAGEFYNRGEEKQAYEIFIKGAEDLSSFSIKDKIFTKVYADYDTRNANRKTKNTVKKVPFYIDGMDKYTNGGPETGEAILAMAESGIGKSQFLIHYAIQTSRRGKKVAFLQIEGTKKQVLDRIDAAWTGALYHDMKNGVIEESRIKQIKTVLRKISGEIYVEAYEGFGLANFTNIRNYVKDVKKLYGDELELVCIDYLELIEIGDGLKYGANDERFKQQKIGRFLKELAMEFDVVLATVTQASNLPSDLKKDPNFVMTREFLSEDKGKIRPFDMFFTFNQTYDEMKNKDVNGDSAPQIRIYHDKIREYQSGQTTKIVTNFKRARFYDRKKTFETVLDYEDDEE